LCGIKAFKASSSGEGAIGVADDEEEAQEEIVLNKEEPPPDVGAAELAAADEVSVIVWEICCADEIVSEEAYRLCL
jgi:hypothetical protein